MRRNKTEIERAKQLVDEALKKGVFGNCNQPNCANCQENRRTLILFLALLTEVQAVGMHQAINTFARLGSAFFGWIDGQDGGVAAMLDRLRLGNKPDEIEVVE